MKQSQFFIKTQKEAPKDEMASNAQLLLRAGFIDKLMAGSYTFLPLGLRTLRKIEQIIREEMNTTGAQEILMPLLHPKSVWSDTGRWDSAKEVMFQLEKDEKEFGLSFTHEEVVIDMLRKRNISYKDLPIKLYQFSNKFRNEPRSRSGLLRGIEFLMKDLYSLHENEEDLKQYYQEVTEAYIRTFERMGLEVRVAEAAGGVFTKENTHEFQVLCENGEDTIYYCDKCAWAQNKEIAQVKEGDKCPACEGQIKVSRSIEVGNIFPLGKWYAEKMGFFYTDKDGNKKTPIFASYGIGSSRLVGTIAEVSHDSKGLIWPSSIAPFTVHLISLEQNEQAEKIYQKLLEKDIEVLYDDRKEINAGEKFAEADLIGLPVRIVVSARTIEADSIEMKSRSSKNDPEIVPLDRVISKLLK